MKKKSFTSYFSSLISHFGFTLIEIMIAIGIIGILAAVILVSTESFIVKGRSARALGQLSSTLPAMYSCWGNSGTVNSPSSGGNICKIGNSDVASYGQWPQVGEGTDLSSYSYDGTITNLSNWFVMLTSDSSHDNKRICCNSAMKSCKVLDTAATNCTASDPAN